MQIQACSPALQADAVADATLYERSLRSDQSLMVKLYGLTYDQVLALGKYIGMFDGSFANTVQTATATLTALQS